MPLTIKPSLGVDQIVQYNYKASLTYKHFNIHFAGKHGLAINFHCSKLVPLLGRVETEYPPISTALNVYRLYASITCNENRLMKESVAIKCS